MAIRDSKDWWAKTGLPGAGKQNIRAPDLLSNSQKTTLCRRYQFVRECVHTRPGHMSDGGERVNTLTASVPHCLLKLCRGAARNKRSCVWNSPNASHPVCCISVVRRGRLVAKRGVCFSVFFGFLLLWMFMHMSRCQRLC